MGSLYPFQEGPRKKPRMEEDDSKPLSSQSTVLLPPPPQPRAQGPTGMGLEDSNSPERLKKAMDNIMDLKVFLITAPACFDAKDIIRRFHLPTDEEVSCVRWNNVFYITGTDIVRCLTYRFAAFGRVITNKKKFEEGVFSDLRNLKNNVDATLEKPKSDFLEFLYKHHCVRTKKKQKVFFWYSVRHERLFIDALERDLKKESSRSTEGTTTAAVSEPALSFKYDPTRSLNDQITGILGNLPTPLAAIANATLTSHNTQSVPPGPMPKQQVRPQPITPMYGYPQPAPIAPNPHELVEEPAPLDVDFFENSDFPLDFLRKEDIRAGNTPTTNHFTGYPEELYDYSMPQRHLQVQGSQSHSSQSQHLQPSQQQYMQSQQHLSHPQQQVQSYPYFMVPQFVPQGPHGPQGPQGRQQPQHSQQLQQPSFGHHHGQIPQLPQSPYSPIVPYYGYPTQSTR